MLSLNDIVKRTFVQGKLGASTIATWAAGDRKVVHATARVVVVVVVVVVVERKVPVRGRKGGAVDISG